MKEMVICKSCNFVMDKASVGDKCPACGVSASMFLPYTERISHSRKMILELDIHPVLVHFVQAFSATIPVLCMIALTGLDMIRPAVTATINVLGVALPFVVVLTFLAGLLDGKIRFRRVTTPILKTKMLVSVVLFLLSCGIFAAVVTHHAADSSSLITLLVLSVPALGCSGFLGFIGVRLLNAAFPG